MVAAKKYKARLKAGVGGHREGIGANAINYKAGDTVASDLDLINAFPGKFEDPRATGGLEEDISSEFDGCEEAGVVVIKRSGRYYVCGPGGAGDEISGVLKKADVEDFIYEHIESVEAGVVGDDNEGDE
jgi:hypothetical protein